MRVRSRLILMLLVFSMILSACGIPKATEAPAVQLPELPAQTPVQEQEEEAVQRPAFLENLPNRLQLSETVLPEGDEASGTLHFYLNDHVVYAGAPMSELMEVDFHTYTDLAQMLQPWHTTSVIRAEFVQAEEYGGGNAFIYFTVLNASDEPCKISEGIIYSMSVTYEKGVRFGSGNEAEPFVTGVTTRDELEAVYGEPTHTDGRNGYYQETFYYSPFNSVSFLFRRGVVMQVNAYHSANVYGQLAEDIDFELTGTAMENDAMILMSQYLDVKPYLIAPGAQEEVPVANADGEEEIKVKMQAEAAEGTGILTSFSDEFTLNGSTITLGCQICELPSPFLEDLNDLSMPVGRNYYIRTGRHDPEEFFVINNRGQNNSMSNTLSIKGVIVENKNYCNWGVDNSAFHSFNCMGITEDSTINDVLDLFGAPLEMLPTASERHCFVWMHYETEAGDYLRIRVDPMLNQVIEVHQVKEFEVERTY